MINIEKATKYEINASKKFMKENLKDYYSNLQNQKQNKERYLHPLAIKEFFENSVAKWNSLANHISDKTCLEIGSGPAGHIIGFYWAKRRIIIDPLVLEYKRMSLKLFKRTWFTDDLELYAKKADENIPELENLIDGVIICRNALDHCEYPYKILDNIAKYAKKGCYLLLWTDLYHLTGHNEGHCNITQDKSAFRSYIVNLGFRIVSEYTDKERLTINFGCTAIKE